MSIEELRRKVGSSKKVKKELKKIYIASKTFEQKKTRKKGGKMLIPQSRQTRNRIKDKSPIELSKTHKDKHQDYKFLKRMFSLCPDHKTPKDLAKDFFDLINAWKKDYDFIITTEKKEAKDLPEYRFYVLLTKILGYCYKYDTALAIRKRIQLDIRLINQHIEECESWYYTKTGKHLVRFNKLGEGK